MDEEDKPPLPVVPTNSGPPTISLNVLLDFAVQQIFHEITVLSELLPKKQEADRKISLVQFANSTRMLFVKLQALVKWVKSSKKFDACSSICYMLEQNAQYFVETADRMFTLSREELMAARLPAFQVSSAVDVLTTGTFPRLPLCIKDRFIKEKKITAKEQANILHRINQILQYRVSRVASKLSPRIKEVRIKNGIVTLVVPGEFEVQMTVLGEAMNTKWTLLNIKMLVEDYEIGYGTQLVHPLQLNMLHNVLQSRMNTSKNPVGEVYAFVHSFAQTLQLDVLFCQSSQMSAGRLRDNIIIEKYDVKERCLTIGYWVQRVAQRKGSTQYRLVSQYRLTVYGDSEDADSALKVRHFPNAPGLGQLDLRTGRLSVDRLLSETLAVRCRERLLRIRKRLEAAEPKAPVALTGQAAPCLSIPLLRDSVENEQEWLMISVNMFTGRVLCTLAAIENCRSEMRELEKSLYDSHTADTLRRQLDRLKILLMIERYRRSITAQQVRIVNEAQMAPIFKEVQSVSQDRICLQFIKEEQYYLIVTFTTDNHLSVRMGMSLLNTTEDKVQLLELSEVLPHLSPMDRVIRLEELSYGSESEGPMGRAKGVGIAQRMEQQLSFAVAAVDDRLSFLRVCLELDRKNIRYKSIEQEPHVGGLVLHVTDLSSVLDKKCPEFFENLVRCCLRLDNRARMNWPFECCMVNPPLTRDIRQPALSQSVASWVQELTSLSTAANSESISHAIKDRLTRYLNIFDIVQRFSRVYDSHFSKYCNVVAYTYHKLVIAYGSNRDQLLVVFFQPRSSPPSEPFKLTFGQTLARVSPDNAELNWEEGIRWNTHCMMTSILTTKFNKDNNLVELVHYLISTSVPLHALSAFSRIRFQSCKVIAQLLGVDIPYPLKLKCHLVAINQNSVRLTYSDIHLEIALLGNEQVAVRDSSRHRPRAAGLHQFFMLLSGGTAVVVDAPVGEPKIQEPPSPSGAAPLSLPSKTNLSVSPMPPTHTNMASAPPTIQSRSPGQEAPANRSGLTASSEAVIVSHETLTKACKFTKTGDGQPHAPLDDFLFSLTFLQRLNASFEAYKRGSMPNMLGGHNVLKELSYDLDYVRVVIPSVNPQGMAIQYSPCNITFNFHLDPVTVTLRLKIIYAMETPPADADVAILEKYFEQVVFRLNNELAVMAFIQLCRLTPHNTVASLAQVMQLQMEPPPFTASAVNLQLVYLARDQNSSNRRFCCGVITDQTTNGNVLILVAFRPIKQPGERSNEKQIVKMFYNLSNNSVRQQGTEEEHTASIMQSATIEAARTGDCPLWSAIRQLSERASSGAAVTVQPGSVQMPPSVSQMPPGSVASIASVPQIGSVGGPVSVGNSSVHNPGSMMNPGSNTGM